MGIRFLVLALLTMQQFFLFGTTTSEVFSKYPNKYFIETGTCIGEGVDNAIKAGFVNIFSIELSPKLYFECKKKFESNKNVKIFLGDSSKLLSVVLREIDAPATFWLDGHYSGGNTVKGSKWSPILEELEAIKNHYIHNHTILIDDLRCCSTHHFDYVSLDEIISKILEINPNYQFFYEDGVVPNDVLVAKIVD